MNTEKWASRKRGEKEQKMVEPGAASNPQPPRCYPRCSAFRIHVRESNPLNRFFTNDLTRTSGIWILLIELQPPSSGVGGNYGIRTRVLGLFLGPLSYQLDEVASDLPLLNIHPAQSLRLFFNRKVFALRVRNLTQNKICFVRDSSTKRIVVKTLRDFQLT